jgi:hypothetical protein
MMKQHLLGSDFKCISNFGDTTWQLTVCAPFLSGPDDKKHSEVSLLAQTSASQWTLQALYESMTHP